MHFPSMSCNGQVAMVGCNGQAFFYHEYDMDPTRQHFLDASLVTSVDILVEQKPIPNSQLNPDSH